MSIIGNIGGQSGGGSLTKSILIVTAPTGSTVTVTKGATTKTATEKNGEWWFKNLENGEWTIRAELDGKSAEEIFNITQFGVYRKAISYRMTPEFTYTSDYEVVQDDDTPITDFATWKGNWKIRFLTSGDFTITNMHGFAGKIDVFMVGGGGGGNGHWAAVSNYGGGGGGGYTKTKLGMLCETGKPYQIKVGAGGTAGNKGGETSSFSDSVLGGNPGKKDRDGGGNGGSGGGTYYDAGGSDGNGRNKSTGQGTTTREFGELKGTLYAGGGNGGWNNAGGPSRTEKDDPSIVQRGNAPNNRGGGGTGGYDGASSGYLGGSGIVIIRNAREVAQ